MVVIGGVRWGLVGFSGGDRWCKVGFSRCRVVVRDSVRWGFIECRVVVIGGVRWVLVGAEW